MKSTDPDTLEDAEYKTEIRFFYTQRGLYFGIVNHQPAETIISRLTARDTSPFDMVVDAIGVVIDASGDGRYGYGMRLGLGDSQTDISILPERQINAQWDGAWDGRTQVIEEGWSAEFFMPRGLLCRCRKLMVIEELDWHLLGIWPRRGERGDLPHYR